MSLIIEKRIWEYIDGSCSLADAKEIAGLIQSDPEYNAVYQELRMIDESMKGFELDEPSMSFNRNLMETLSIEPTPGSIKSLIDKRIVNGIAGFFLVTIFALVITAVSEVNWEETLGKAGGGAGEGKISYISISTTTESILLKGFYFLDAVLGLYLLDMWLRRSVTNKKIIHNS